ncbi:hypothetical protein OIHEL45_19126 [Sulfitobacter indolifex HEL-45]|uniref:Uncharacterized protein n=1 Tax=Sulfitobacter indolifex HEL-45 TaxID=391624 RepID=A0ABP2D704_9RHOB|nr:hypothetical protein OIHEL45_19126 [Sulfitobacter indolifex HEL-45]
MVWQKAGQSPAGLRRNRRRVSQKSGDPTEIKAKFWANSEEHKTDRRFPALLCSISLKY